MKKVCLLYSNAGAGHYAAAKALFVALGKKPGVQVEMVNFAEAYKVKGYDRPGLLYKFWLKYFPWFYGVIVWFVNQTLPLWFLRNTYKLAAMPNFALFMQEHDADVYLSTYYFDHALFEYVKEQHPEKRMIMLVTDIVFALRIWFSPVADQIIVPTQELYDNGKKYFKNYADKVKIMGLPIAEEYFQKYDQKALKQKLGLTASKSILVFGGGEGMNKVPAIVKAIDGTNNDIDIVVVCGRDFTQKKNLEMTPFRNNVKILGWIENFSECLLASDIVISKAGPTTIWECMTAKKQLILFSYIRGQESGNIEFANKHLHAIYLPNPILIGKCVSDFNNSNQGSIIRNIPGINSCEQILNLLLSQPVIDQAVC